MEECWMKDDARAGQKLFDQELEQMLTTPSALQGFHNKTDDLSPGEWVPDQSWWRLMNLKKRHEELKMGAWIVRTIHMFDLVMQVNWLPDFTWWRLEQLTKWFEGI